MTVYIAWFLLTILTPWQGSEGDQECIIYTFNTYQAAFACDILCCNCTQEWEIGRQQDRTLLYGRTNVNIEIDMLICQL